MTCPAFPGMLAVPAVFSILFTNLAKLFSNFVETVYWTPSGVESVVNPFPLLMTFWLCIFSSLLFLKDCLKISLDKCEFKYICCLNICFKNNYNFFKYELDKSVRWIGTKYQILQQY